MVIYNSRKKRRQQNSPIRCRVENEFNDGREKSTTMAMEDRFSNMPEPIIHHIMSFLPKSIDTMSLSMVSKTFSSASRSSPIINLDFYHYSYAFPLKTKVLFLDSMVNYLQSRHANAVRLDKLRFVVGRHTHLFDRFSNMIIETLFRFAIDSNVKELELNFGTCFHEPNYNQSLRLRLPPQLCFSKTIRVLKLTGISPIQDLIISSPSLENLTLIDCEFIGSFNLGCNDNLKIVEIRDCGEIRIEGPTPCLEYLSCYTSDADKCKLDITKSTFPKLKHLEFNDDYVISPEPWINKLSDFSVFCFLETLELFGCYELKDIKFQLEHLKALVLVSAALMKVEIDAPNLVSLIYESKSIRPPEINISSSSTNLKHLDFQDDYVPRRWVAQNFSEFRVLETLKLRIKYKLKNVKFHLEYLNALELVFEASKVEIEAPNLVSLTYESGFISSVPPEINISSNSTSLKHLKYNGQYVPHRWVANDFSEFCVLETLELHAYDTLDKVKFHLPCLKVLNLFLPDKRLIQIEILAPNLVSFIYEISDASMFFKPLLTFRSNAKPDVIVKVPCHLDQRHFPNIMHFIACFAHCCNTLTLRHMVSDYKGLIYPKKQRKNFAPPWYNLKHLKVELVKLVQSSLYQLIDSLLWLAPHPNTLSFIVGSKVKSLKFHYKNENVENWQHDLEEVVLTNFEGNEVAILQEYLRKLLQRK